MRNLPASAASAVSHMEMLVTVVTAAVLALLSLDLPLAGACSCAYTHPQVQFCGSDFVIKARVKDERMFNMGIDGADMDVDTRFNEVELERDWSMIARPVRRYTIKISKIFKENEIFKNISKEFVYTPASEAGCGVSLTPYTKYLIMGRVLEGMPDITICGFQKEWTAVSRRMKRDLQKAYKQNCDSCTIETCYHPNCMREKRTRTHTKCFWNPRQDPGRCYMKYGACTSRPTSSGRRNRCKWTKNTPLSKCLSDTQQEILRAH